MAGYLRSKPADQGTRTCLIQQQKVQRQRRNAKTQHGVQVGRKVLSISQARGGGQLQRGEHDSNATRAKSRMMIVSVTGLEQHYFANPVWGTMGKMDQSMGHLILLRGNHGQSRTEPHRIEARLPLPGQALYQSRIG